MKKLIKGLYIALFPEEYSLKRELYIKDIESRLIYTEDLLLSSVGENDHYTQGQINDKVFQIKCNREVEEKYQKFLKKII